MWTGEGRLPRASIFSKMMEEDWSAILAVGGAVDMGPVRFSEDAMHDRA